MPHPSLCLILHLPLPTLSPANPYPTSIYSVLSLQILLCDSLGLTEVTFLGMGLKLATNS